MGGGEGVVNKKKKEKKTEIWLADFQVSYSSFYLNPGLTLCLAACQRDCFIIRTLFFRFSAYTLPPAFSLILVELSLLLCSLQHSSIACSTPPTKKKKKKKKTQSTHTRQASFQRWSHFYILNWLETVHFPACNNRAIKYLTGEG